MADAYRAPTTPSPALNTPTAAASAGATTATTANGASEAAAAAAAAAAEEHRIVSSPECGPCDPAPPVTLTSADVDPDLLAMAPEELDAYAAALEEQNIKEAAQLAHFARIQDLQIPHLSKAKQIEHAQMLLIKGWQSWQIKQEFRLKYGIHDETIQRRIDAARAIQVAEVGTMTRADKAAELVQVLQDVSRIAREQGRGSDVIGSSRLQCELLGILNRSA